MKHGSDDGLVLGDQQVEGVGVGEDVVRVGVLRREGDKEKRKQGGKEAPTSTTSKVRF